MKWEALKAYTDLEEHKGLDRTLRTSTYLNGNTFRSVLCALQNCLPNLLSEHFCLWFRWGGEGSASRLRLVAKLSYGVNLLKGWCSVDRLWILKAAVHWWGYSHAGAHYLEAFNQGIQKLWFLNPWRQILVTWVDLALFVCFSKSQRGCVRWFLPCTVSCVPQVSGAEIWFPPFSTPRFYSMEWEMLKLLESLMWHFLMQWCCLLGLGPVSKQQTSKAPVSLLFFSAVVLWIGWGINYQAIDI